MSSDCVSMCLLILGGNLGFDQHDNQPSHVHFADFVLLCSFWNLGSNKEIALDLAVVFLVFVFFISILLKDIFYVIFLW